MQFTPTGSFSTVGTLTIMLALSAGSNTIEFSNPSAYAPDFDRIIVGGGVGPVTTALLIQAAVLAAAVLAAAR